VANTHRLTRQNPIAPVAIDFASDGGVVEEDCLFMSLSGTASFESGIPSPASETLKRLEGKHFLRFAAKLSFQLTGMDFEDETAA
jgi:hypothetical protein